MYKFAWDKGKNIFKILFESKIFFFLSNYKHNIKKYIYTIFVKKNQITNTYLYDWWLKSMKE